MYPQPPRPVVTWDEPGPAQGVTVERQLDDGNWYAWYVPHNGVAPQAMAADILGVSVMTINNWVNAGDLRHIKSPGQPSLIPLADIKRVKVVLDEHGRLRRSALGE